MNTCVSFKSYPLNNQLPSVPHTGRKLSKGVTMAIIEVIKGKETEIGQRNKAKCNLPPFIPRSMAHKGPSILVKKKLVQEFQERIFKK